MDSGKQTDGCFVMLPQSPSRGHNTNDSVPVAVTCFVCQINGMEDGC